MRLILVVARRGRILASHGTAVVVSALLVEAVRVLHAGRVVPWPLANRVIGLQIIDLSSLCVLGYAAAILSLLIGTVSLTLFLALLLRRGQRHGRQMYAALLRLLRRILLFGVRDDVAAQPSTRDIGLPLIPTVYRGAALRRTSFGRAASDRPAVGPHHRGDVDGSMESVALAPRHHIAVLLLALRASSTLIRGHDDSTEVANCVPWRGQLGHLDWAGCATSWVLLVDTGLTVWPK